MRRRRPPAAASAALPARRLLAGLLAVLLLGACESETRPADVPNQAALEGLYGTRASASLSGNVVDVRVTQDADQLRRGGPLWARVGPYIYLFSPQTRDIFHEYSGVAAVRVRTVTGEDSWVAEATLHRDTLNAITWKDAVRTVARARQQGTDKPGYLEDLVEFGEERTEHRYNEQYTQR